MASLPPTSLLEEIPDWPDLPPVDPITEFDIDKSINNLQINNLHIQTDIMNPDNQKTPPSPTHNQRQGVVPSPVVTTGTSSTMVPLQTAANERVVSRPSTLWDEKEATTEFIVPQSSAIATFRVTPSEAPGFYAKNDVNVKRKMELRTHCDLPSFSLGKPAVRGNRFLVGTDDPSSHSHYLVYLNGESILSSITADPIVSYIRVNEHVRDIKWITSSTILAALGDGRLSIFNKAGDGSLAFEGNLPAVHTASIREMAQRPGHPMQVATGGFDQTLCFHDLDHPDVITQQRLRTTDVIGSVRWPIWNGQVCPSVTLDGGSYIMYDLRQTPAVVAFQFDSQIPNLYSHERYTDHNVLLGYQGGDLKNLDMRRGGAHCVISTESDPWCGGIGGIEFNYEKHAFVTSGFTDFTVWKQSEVSEVTLWSHSKDGINTVANEDGYNVSASWFDQDTIVTADSAGCVGLYIQKLP